MINSPISLCYNFFHSSDSANVNSTDCPSTGQSQHSDDSNTGAVKRTFAESTENSEENNAANTGATADEESRRKKRKDETGKEGKSTPQRNTGKDCLLEFFHYFFINCKLLVNLFSIIIRT